MERVGRYEIVRSLAQGGMGEVLLARLSGPAGFARPVVVKRVRADVGRKEHAQAMLLDEARLTSRLNHPHIAQGIDLVETDDGVFLVMEYVEGTDFGALLRRAATAGRSPDFLAVAWVVSRVACALHFAHHATDPNSGRPLSVIHRDVTPSNILLSTGGDVKLSDFGVAKADTQQVKTVQGTVKGKVGYLSPEQCNLEPLDARSDLFSLGIVLYEGLTLRRLFREQDPLRAMQRICDERVAPPSDHNAEIPRELDAIVARALQKDRHDRFQTAGAMQEALEQWMFGHAPSRRERGATTQANPRMISPERTLVEWMKRLHLDDSPRRPASPPEDAGSHGAESTVSDTVRTPIDAIFDADTLRLTDVTAALVPISFPLPRFSTPHVGRDVELAAMRSHFDHGGRALSVIGPTGIGKTRLCVEFCRRVRAEGARRPFRAEIYVDTALITRLDVFCDRVASTLGVQLSPADEMVQLSQLGAALQHLGDVLVVFDDVGPEVVPAAIARLQAMAPLMRVLAVARKPLDLPGVSIFALRAFPQHGAEPKAIFVGAVCEVRPTFVGTDLDKFDLDAFLQSLGGHPQAIALLAGRIGSSDDPQEALRTLKALFAAHPEHLDGDGVAAWIVASSAPQTRALLSLTTAFEGPALLSEIRECMPRVDASDLHRLHRQGFVRLLNGPNENAYVVTDVVRRSTHPTFDDFKRIRDVTVARAEFAVQSATKGSGREEHRAYLEFVRERLMPLAEQALLARDPRVAARLALVALRMGVSSTHATALLDRIASALGDDDLGVRLEIALGTALAKRGKVMGAARVLAHAATLARQGADALSLAEALLEQGKVDAQKRPDAARGAFDEALAIATAREDTLLEERVRTARAQVLSKLNHDDAALIDLERARALAKARGSRAREGRLALALAALADRADRTVVAAEEARFARVHLEATGDFRGAFEAALLWGHVIAGDGQTVEAKRAFVFALSLATKQGDVASQVRAMGALAATAALSEGSAAARVYFAGIDALLLETGGALSPTVDVYRGIVDLADGTLDPKTLDLTEADGMAARLFERVALGRGMLSTEIH